MTREKQHTDLDEGLGRLRKGGVYPSPPVDTEVPPAPPAQRVTVKQVHDGIKLNVRHRDAEIFTAAVIFVRNRLLSIRVKDTSPEILRVFKELSLAIEFFSDGTIIKCPKCGAFLIPIGGLELCSVCGEQETDEALIAVTKAAKRREAETNALRALMISRNIDRYD